MKNIPLLLLALFIFSACSGSGDNTSLKSTGWLLDSMPGLSIMPENKNVSLDFSATGKVSGYGGCNQFEGLYKVSGKNISFINILSTEKACINSQIEATFFSALRKADSYKISGGKLMLYERGAVLVIMNER